ncbi:50S ribosomal protein L1 [bacterium]|nr:50S ribosomal protein L1 [bacterium]
MAGLTKKTKAVREKVSSTKFYGLDEAATLLSTLPKAKFDEAVDIAVKLGVDPRKAEENVRGVVSLPHGNGKTVRVVAFCTGAKAKEAEEAGADFVGTEELVQKIQGGWLEFDKVVATPDMMVMVSKVGKILGPRGLMPNPKLGSVTPEVGKAIKSIKAGQVEFRVEKAGIVHASIGKVSFGTQKIKENVESMIDAIIKMKPKTSKGVYLETISISSTMGPGIAIDPVPYRKV